MPAESDGEPAPIIELEFADGHFGVWNGADIELVTVSVGALKGRRSVGRAGRWLQGLSASTRRRGACRTCARDDEVGCPSPVRSTYSAPKSADRIKLIL